ncbi:hypothetical protein FOZ63_033914 [Perkinsus olseni]|uniref:Radical SAM core domain-containing protein n=1 Tax=Perkinsus olseni TaxID=32597 RepID=A0A7J6SZ29_PEROL|nr:hypothetical protein FOZ63_033914 [Perkinsus olseni]
MPEVSSRSGRHRDLCSLREPLLDTPALEDFLGDVGSSRLHAVTIQKALVADVDFDPSQVPTVPKRAAALLDKVFVRISSTVAMKQVSSDGTTKILLRLQDGKEVESVIIPAGDRRTLCVSSQVGCRMGCRFCATGTLGLSGNLSSGEILEQLWHANRVSDKPIGNVVFMGMGEPLENYDAVLAAIKGMNSLFAVPQRCITVSTVGVVPKIRALAHDASGVKLALSLHAPTQDLREKIVPSAKAWSIQELMLALDEYAQANLCAGRPDDINDTSDCAHKLGELLGNRKVVVNLIPYNVVDNGSNFEPPLESSVRRMVAILKDVYGIRVYHRRHHGRDIDAACGQLAKKKPHGVPDLEDLSGAAVAGRSLAPLESSGDEGSELGRVAVISLGVLVTGIISWRLLRRVSPST